MKISKQKLKQIIKEELEQHLFEMGVSPKELGLSHDISDPQVLMADINKLIDSGNVPNQDRVDDLLNLLNNALKKNPDEQTKADLQNTKNKLISKSPYHKRRAERRGTYKEPTKSAPNRVASPGGLTGEMGIQSS
jgi:hypothetical protein